MIHLALPDKQALAAEDLARITEARRAKEMDYRRNRAAALKVTRGAKHDG